MNIGYTPSQLTENDVILEKLNSIIEYLSDHPSYQVYAYNGGFISGTLTYEIANVLNSANINVADVVVFNNGYYGIISEITETEFTLTAGISLIGPQGAKGDKGDKGDYGTGIFMYLKPIKQDLYQIDMGYVAKVSGRELQNGDILFSLYDATLGNIAWVIEVDGELRMQYVASLKGPQGPAGPQGPVGPQGPSGVLGEWQTATMDTELADGTYLIKMNIYDIECTQIVTLASGSSGEFITLVSTHSNEAGNETNFAFYTFSFANKKLSPSYKATQLMQYDTGNMQLLVMSDTWSAGYQYILMK